MSIWRRLVGGGDETIARARRPQTAAADLDEPPKQGLDWLGREPEANAPLLYRALLLLARLFLFGLCRLRVQVTGRQHLPPAGCIAVVALHRSWVDPLLVVEALPREPRPWFLGLGPPSFDRRWKEWLLRRTGGLLPVWRGSGDPSVHVRSAQAVVDHGGVLALFAEGRIGGPPDAPGTMRSGAALLCLRTGAPIVPIAVCGADELYRGKRHTIGHPAGDVATGTARGCMAWESRAGHARRAARGAYAHPSPFRPDRPGRTRVLPRDGRPTDAAPSVALAHATHALAAVDVRP